MGSAASTQATVEGLSQHKDNLSKEDLINSLLPHFTENPEKCAEIYQILMDRAKLEQKKQTLDKSDTTNVPFALTGTKGYSEEIATALNMVRLNPKSYITFAQAHLDSFVDDTHYKDKLGRENLRIRTREGKAAVLDCIEYLKSAEPVRGVVPNSLLEKAAIDHVSDLSANNLLSHTGSDGGSTQDRIEKYVHWRGSIGETIDCGNLNATSIILSLLIDDGTPSRGHRASIMNPEFLIVGAAVGNHPTYSVCSVIDFATSVVDWTDMQREDIIVEASYNEQKNLPEIFNKVLRSIPVENLIEDVNDMLKVEGTVVIIDFKVSTCSAVITKKNGKATRQISLQWGANKV